MQKSLKQQAICDSDNKNILVSASAGCGKTTAMINRIIRLITRDKVELKNMLIVTYTNAAADDIKDKLFKELKKINHRDSFIIKQLNYLDFADISTLHSFCSKILKNYFYIVNIEPKFEILEENNSRCFKLKALNKVLNEYYENNNPDFMDLTEILSYNRSASLIPKIIIDLYEKSACFTDKESFKQTCLNACNLDLKNNKVLNFVNGYISEFSLNYIFKLEELYKGAYLEKHKTVISDCIEVLKCLTAGNLEEKLNVLNILNFPSVKALSKPEKEDALIADFHENLKIFKTQLTEKLKTLKSKYPPFDDTELIENLKASQKYISVLLEITDKFEKEYTALKNENCALDFSDLEKLTIQVLKNKDVLKELKNKYKYVFVDECQDINEVQDYIISVLSPDNLFCVGDVKQCIYRFRGAKPEIFIDKCVNAPAESFFRLDENYRTNTQILDFVNEIFGGIMFKDFSLVDYEKTENLSGKNFGKLSDGHKAVVCDIVEKIKEDENNEEANDEEEIKKAAALNIYSVKNDKAIEEQAEYEGLIIADRIKDLINNNIEIINDERYLKEKERSAKICYSDISILVRGKKGYTEKIFRTIKNEGIPISAEFKYSVREYEEVEELIQYLFLIDNFYQDIPLLSVLKSPLGGFSDYELSLIKLNNPHDFHICFNDYKKFGKDADLKNKVCRFMETLIKHRRFSEFNTVSALLELIITDSGYEAKLLETTDGINKVNRLNSFIAGLYEKIYEESLCAFNNFITNFGDEMKISESCSCGDCVKINTIHQSKGLEYPVVILAGNQNKFNFASSLDIMPYHPHFGIAFKDYDILLKTVTDTPVHQGIRQAIKYEQVKEELNILYVAMTRARYRLYITGTVNPLKIKSAVTGFDVKNGESPVNLFKIYSEPSGGKNYELFKTDSVIEKKNDKINKKFVLEDKPVDIDLDKIINSEYAYKDSLNTPFKLSVTEASKSLTDIEDVYNIERVYGEDFTDTGNIYHKIFQNINLNGNTPDEILNELNRLRNEKIISENYDINIKNIERFLNLEIIKNLKHTEFYRERPFMISVPYNSIPYNKIGGVSSEQVLLQGKIDLLIINENAATIIDYKVSNKNGEYLLSKYASQLEIYGKAVKKILEIENIDLYIYSVLNGRLIAIPKNKI